MIFADTMLVSLASLVQDPEVAEAASLTTEERLEFQNMPELWLVGLVLVPLVIAFAWWSYGGLSRLELRTRVVLSVLRGLAILACLIALFQPILEIREFTQIESQVHFLIDDSASMQRKDTYPDPRQNLSLSEASGVRNLAEFNRAELVQRVLEKEGALISQLEETHDVRLYRFTRKPTKVQNLGELTAKGPTSPLGDALRLHLEAAAGSPLDAVILVSDGRNNAGLAPVDVAAKYRAADIPLYTIGVGDPNAPSNVRIIGPPGPKESLRQEEVMFNISVVKEGESLNREPVDVTLEASRNGGAYLPVHTESTRLPSLDGEPVRVRANHAFQEAGDYTLRFKVSEFPQETSLEDNVDIRFLRVNDEKIRVLYLEEVPRWEYRYVKNALKRVDESIVMQAFLFDASGDFIQEHSEGLLPLRSLPRTRDELFNYHVILIGDVNPSSLGDTDERREEWIKLLQEFVEFGGGVGFMFGEDYMPESYRGSLIQDMLPVVLENISDYETARGRIDRVESFRPILQNPTAPHDIALMDPDIEHNATLWKDDLSGLRIYYPAQQPKAGAEVILRHPSDSNKFGKRVIAATGQFPRGRTFFIATDETWMWRKPFGEYYQDTFWRNVVRHLAENRLRRRDDRVDLRLSKLVAETGESITITLLIHDDELQPSTAQEAVFYLRRADGDPERRTLRAVPDELGRYQGTFSLDRPASVSVLVFDNDNPLDQVLAREDVLVKIPDREMSHSSQDRETLEMIAKSSKDGRYVFLGDANDLAEDFRDRRTPDTEIHRQIRTLWDKWWVLAVIVGLLAVEWILRKRARLV